ncbi:MAG: sulfite reductase subunit A [Oceanospirillaceae bacterium]|nr:sulfite reductase subunit A [Oceanospirillaceae bacterium]
MEIPGYLPREQLQALLERLQQQGYRCVGPRVREGAMVYDDINHADQLAVGYTQTQEPGHYRLKAGSTVRQFAWANGPQALKPLTFAPREDLWCAQEQPDGSLKFHPAATDYEPVAVIGVRACDLAALRLQEQHFLDSCADPQFAVRRRSLFLIAVNCTHPAQTCFCASTGDGPEVDQDCDLSLYETDEGFFVSAVSPAGQQLALTLPLEHGDAELFKQACAEVTRAGEAQVRRVPAKNLRDSLFAQLDHPRWKEVAERCLSCGNCTQVCPTCFCHSETSVPSVDGHQTTHQRQWDSCFSPGHTYIHGITLRKETEQRYRQWLTHKFGSWHDQYGRSGCVGCGRCISWCPVGIDPTEELDVICTDVTGRPE